MEIKDLTNLSYKDLIQGKNLKLPLSWQKPNGEVNKIVFPKCITQRKANIIILSPEHFPTGSCNDAVAFFTLLKMKKEKKLVDNTVIVGAHDSNMVSFAWASSVLGIKCIIKTPQMSFPYWMKRAKDYGATIEKQGVKANDVSRILDSNKKEPNFISQFKNPTAYTFHEKVTSDAIKKAIKGIGNNKIAVTVIPSSSGGLSGALHQTKKNMPYSKSLIVEPESCSTFYNNCKGDHKLYGMGYGFIPYIHRISSTDYVVSVPEKEVLKVTKSIESFSDKITTLFNADSKTIKPIVGKLSPMTIACIMASTTIANQLYLSEEDNIVIIAETTAAPYSEIIKDIPIEDIDVKHIIEEGIINKKFRPILDLTGQRQRDRLYKKKIDFWTRRMENESLLNTMKEDKYWENLSK